jgi:hypothetical protein
LRERLQGVWQLVGTRHPRAAYEHRNNGNVAVKGRGDLKPHRILGILEAPVPLGIGTLKPFGTNQGEEHIARPHSLFDDLNKVLARRDRVDVHKHMVVLAKPRAEPVRESDGISAGIVTPVADEHMRLGCHDYRRGLVTP